MATELPVVFLAFANANAEHLGLLKTESRELFEALQPLQDAGQIALRREESCEFDELYRGLVAAADHLVIFHYGGHANGQKLQFEGGGGAREGLAGLLGQQHGLKLVFLNGCATQGHVASLLSAGVPAVIATSVPVGDQKAQELSVAFYAALAKGQTIPAAFASSRDFLTGKYARDGGVVPTFTRQIGGDDEGAVPESAVMAWSLFMRPECVADLETWRLPEARADWQVHLEDRRGPIRDLDGHPLVVEHRLPLRTMPVRRCATCGTASIAPRDKPAVRRDREPVCPICGSSDTTPAEQTTTIAEAVLRFGVSAEQALERVLADVWPPGGAAATRPPQSPAVRLAQVYCPCWVVDLGSRTTLSAERGVAGDLNEVVPKIEWEPVHEEIDIARTGHLVVAGAAPGGVDATASEWRWNLDAVEPLARLDQLEGAAVPMDRSLQSAFAQVAADLSEEIDAEVAQRVGGVQQRNVAAETRYLRVAARSVLLPCWYATVDREGTTMSLMVNGQTGAVRRFTWQPVADGQQGKAAWMNDRTYDPVARPPGPSPAVSVFSGVGIGLMVGIMLGLAAPSGDGRSIVAYFIAAVGSGLAALLGLNDTHFSTAKGLRIGAFGLAVLVAAPAGIFVRAHNLLGTDPPSLATRKAEYLALGLQESEALALLAGAGGTAEPAAPSREMTPADKSGKGALFGQAGRNNLATRLGPENFDNDPAETLKALTRENDQFKELATAIQTHVSPSQQLTVVRAVLRVVCKVQDPEATCP